MRKFIFIGGTGRSGTTAMRRALIAQPCACGLSRELRVHVEGGGLIDLLQGGRKSVGHVFKQKVDRITHRHPGRKDRTAFFQSRVAPHTKWIVCATPPSPTAISKRKRLAREYMERVFRPSPGQIIVEDSPPNMRRAEDLKMLFPSARFIHMVRHPLHVLVSTMKRWGAGKGAYANAEAIAYHLEKSIQQERAMGECAVRVRLEDIALSRSATKEALGALLPEFDVDTIASFFDHGRVTKHEVDDDVRRAYHRYLHRFAVDLGY